MPFTFVPYCTGGVVLSSNVSATHTSLTFSWILVGGVTVTSYYVIYYSNTNRQCFIGGGNDLAGINATQKTLFDLEEDTQYSISLMVILSTGKLEVEDITATTRAAG